MGTPKDLLIECQGCKVENIFNGYTPDRFLVCNQCRDRLIEPNLGEVSLQFECQDCGFSIVVLKQTNFQLGDSACRCGSKNLSQIQPITLYREAEKAGAFTEAENQPVDNDWYRSEKISEEALDYNQMFDNDMGDN